MIDMYMTEDEICDNYVKAANHREQVQILADLNACKQYQIAAILGRNGFCEYMCGKRDLYADRNAIIAKLKNGTPYTTIASEYHTSGGNMKKLLQEMDLWKYVKTKNDKSKEIVKMEKSEKTLKEVVKKIENAVNNSENLVEHPKHYNHTDRKECWDEMLEKFGADATIIFDCMSAYKYDYRKGSKDGNPEEQDKAKIDNYIEHSDKLVAKYGLHSFAAANAYVKIKEIVKG